LTIRKAKLSDTKPIAEIYSHHIDTGESCMFTDPIHETEIREMILNLKEREVLAVIELDNDIAGWGILKMYSPRLGYRFTCENSIFLNPNSLGKGIGKELMSWLMVEAKSLNFRHIVAKILCRNESSILFHEKFGYTTVGIQKEIGFLNDQWEDVVIMQKLIK